MQTIQHAEFFIASTKLTVMVAEESAEGLTVLAENPPMLWVDDTGQLESENGAFQVRVKSVTRTGLEGGTDDSAAVFEIGLERLRKLDAFDRTSQRVTVRRAVAASLISLFPAESSGALVRTCLAIMLVAAPLFIAAMATHHGLPFIMNGADCCGGQPACVAEPVAPVKPVAIAPVAVVEKSPAPTVDLGERVRKLPGAEPLLDPAVADRLKLTAQQRAAVGRLDETTRQALREFQARWSDKSLAEQNEKRAMILVTARQEALDLLVGPQRQAWDELIRAPAASK